MKIRTKGRDIVFNNELVELNTKKILGKEVTECAFYNNGQKFMKGFVVKIKYNNGLEEYWSRDKYEAESWSK